MFWTRVVLYNLFMRSLFINNKNLRNLCTECTLSIYISQTKYYLFIIIIVFVINRYYARINHNIIWDIIVKLIIIIFIFAF